MTLAHPAAVLPLRGAGLPTTALAVGSMVPDIPLFLGWVRGYEATHGVAGVLVLDVVLASVVVGAWFLGIRDAVVDMSPLHVRSRLAEHVRLTAREWLLVPLAGCVGAATHVVWDSFTHPGRWGPRHVEWLRTEHAGLLGLKWVQYGSGVLGLAVVTWAAVAFLRSRAPETGPRRPRVLPAFVLPAVLAAAALTGLVSAVASVPEGFHAMAFNGVVDSMVAGVALGALACTWWHAARGLRSPARR